MTQVALELYDNQLTGQLPNSFQYLTSLETLNLDGNGLRGPFPTELGAMTHLKTLNLSKNNLSGIIPTEVGLLSNLCKCTMDALHIAKYTLIVSHISTKSNSAFETAQK